MTTTILSKQTLLFDAAIVGGACLIPSASHLLALPLYQFDPMRWLLLGALVVGWRNNRMLSNGLIMALLLPLVSCLVAGMPSLAKAGLMAVELMANVAVFGAVASLGKGLQGKGKVFGAMLLSVVVAKGVYYALKACCIGMGLMEGAVVGTSLLLQGGLAIAIALTAALTLNRR